MLLLSIDLISCKSLLSISMYFLSVQRTYSYVIDIQLQIPGCKDSPDTCLNLMHSKTQIYVTILILITFQEQKDVKKSSSWTWTIFKCLVLSIIVLTVLNYGSLRQEYIKLRPADGKLYDIGFGHNLFLYCKGHGKPAGQSTIS